jgi:hypothetical protein
MEQIYVLVLDGIPIACGDRHERLAMRMSAYKVYEQLRMSIHVVERLE